MMKKDHDCAYQGKIQPVSHCDICCKLEKFEAYVDGLTAYAWWKDGHQEVGSCGTTLKEAIARARKEFGIEEGE